MTAPRPPKTDRELQTDVLAQLNRDPRLTPAEVGVEVWSGIVTLTGTVSTHEKADVAAEVAISVSEIRDVANKLTVEGDEREHNDTKIARNVRHALGWNSAVPAELIDTIVRHGVVTLRGGVDHWFQRKAAEATAGAVPGVVTVNNQIRLLVPPTSDDILQEEVEDALDHLPACGDVNVVVAKGVVTLRGAVGSSTLRRQVETVAGSSLGVRAVVNELRTR